MRKLSDIIRRDTPVARLSRVERAKQPLKFEAIDAFRAKLIPTTGRSRDLIRRMRDAAC
jgi:hypothetical protein